MVKFDDVSMPESTAPSNSKILLRSISTAVTTPRNRHIHRWSKFTPWLVLFASASGEDQPSLWIRARQKSWDLLGIYGHVYDSSVDFGMFFLCTPFWTNFHIVGCFYHILPCSILIIPIDYGSPIQYLVGGIPTPLQKYEWVTVGMMKFPKNMGKSFKIPWFQSPPTRISSMSSLIPRQRPPNPRIALPRIRKRQASERIPVRSEAPWAQSGMILFWYCKMI